MRQRREKREGEKGTRSWSPSATSRLMAPFVLPQTLPKLQRTEEENLWLFRAFRFFFPHFQSSPSALSLPRAPDTAERREATSGRAVPGPVPCPRCPGCPQSCPRAAAAGAEPPAGAGPQQPGPRRAWVPSVLPRIYSIRQLGMLGREEGGLIR